MFGTTGFRAIGMNPFIEGKYPHLVWTIANISLDISWHNIRVKDKDLGDGIKELHDMNVAMGQKQKFMGVQLQESLLQATSSLSDADDLMPTSSPASEPSHLPEPPPSQPPSTNNDIPTDPPSLQHPPSSTSVEPPPHVPESPRPNRKPFCILALLIASIAIIYFGNNYISSRGAVIPKSDEL